MVNSFSFIKELGDEVIIYCNGQYIDEQDAKISPFDHGFLYGMGLFETVRIYKGHPFLLDDHLLRMQKGLQEMGIETFVRKGEILAIIQELLELNRLQDARIRINYSAGVGKAGLPEGHYLHPGLIVFISPLPEAGDQIVKRDAVILKLKRNMPEIGIRLKSHHFGNNIAAKMELQKTYPDAEGIFLTQEGFVAEGITSNIFWVKNGILYTPSENTGILLGITRQWIIAAANKLGYEVREGCFSLSELQDAEEVFLTNSIQEIVGVNQLIGISAYRGATGELTQALHRQYKLERMSSWTCENLL